MFLRLFNEGQKAAVCFVLGSRDRVPLQDGWPAFKPA